MYIVFIGPTGLTFGTPNAMSTGTGFGLSNTIATTSTAANVPSFSLPSSTVPSMTPGLSFDASKTGYNTTTTATTGFPLATTTAGFNFGVGTSTTSSTFLNKTTSAPISTSLTAPSTHTSLGTTTT